ncbi:LysR family transcriptional regulator [Paenibacillus polymyxa]|uniref:LysR family transcriptional regulator n=1 Tax=Paenibacillus polymyxa TaxID=1406 RepID=UPI000DA04696|nr:LysR family transcriptional regulator [Paenibacillus polymyxa]KAE8561882.1 LysR family transcriptional regulator [Paenibacillus polymyxa]MCJ1221231.1 LysR family transcriptional regulator [Paenibacillus polymyxa]SPY14078.1 putative RuBisCO transcriptional regulator [Paenibacillus polymyxa]
MDIKALKTFQMIVNCGSFMRAAETLNYAQSTVTMQIQRLESDLGVQLIERGKKIKLTEAGRMFYEQSLHIVKDMEQLQENMENLQKGTAGDIRIGVTEPTASYRLPEILKRFLNHYPYIRISVEFGNTPTLSERILKGDVDIALCSAPDLGTELYFEPLFKENFVVLMPEHHPLAQKECIGPSDLQGHRLLITSSICPYRRKLEMVMKEHGITTLDTMEIGSMTALKSYVECELGIALVPQILVHPVPAGTAVRQLSGSLIDMTFGLLCKATEAPLKLASARLYSVLKKELGQLS